MADYNRGIQLPGEILNQQEMRRLLAACNRGPSGARNRALLVVLWRARLRTAEALALRPSDLDPAACLVRIRRGKAGKPRSVGMDTEAFATVDAWLARRKGLGLNGHAPLFCTLQGRPLDPGYCRAMIKRLARRAELRKRAHLHGLRHSHAVELVREGTPLPEVKAQLGHSSLSVTSRYLDHVLPEDLAERARSRPSWAESSLPLS